MIFYNNTFINDYRRLSLKNKVINTTEELGSHQLVKSSSRNQGVCHLINEDINKAMEGLDKVYLVPFLRYFEGYKYNEIATELNIPLGTVKTRIHEARKLLKNRLKMYNPKAA